MREAQKATATDLMNQFCTHILSQMLAFFPVKLYEAIEIGSTPNDAGRPKKNPRQRKMLLATETLHQIYRIFFSPLVPMQVTSA